MQTDNVEFKHPMFAIFVGRSASGKTTLCNRIVEQVINKKKFNIVYVVNDAFSIELELLEMLKKHKNVHIIKCDSLKKEKMDPIQDYVKGLNTPTLIIMDNFTYGLRDNAFLNFTTYSRKYNCSVIYIAHTLYGAKAIYPRLRELLSYLVIFYINNSKLKYLLGEEIEDVYVQNIRFREYTKLIYDFNSQVYMVAGKDYVPQLVFANKEEEAEYTKQKEILQEIEAHRAKAEANKQQFWF